jgi:hypothetical protein
VHDSISAAGRVCVSDFAWPDALIELGDDFAANLVMCQFVERRLRLPDRVTTRPKLNSHAGLSKLNACWLSS